MASIIDLLKEPEEQGGLVEQILSQREQPNFGDWRASINANPAKGYVAPQDFADARQLQTFEKLQQVEKLKQTQRKSEMDMLYRMSQIGANEALAKKRLDSTGGTVSSRRTSSGGGIGAPRPNFGKPPSGYEWNDDGTLAAIPGGPATKLSAELAARIGLAEKAITELPGLKTKVEKGVATGPLDYMTGAFGFGESGKVQRRIKDGADALQRMLTGAGMPASEAEDYSNRFRATKFDTSSTLSDKLVNLEKVLKAQISAAQRGHMTAEQQNTPIDVEPDEDPRIQAARDAGYTDEEIEAYLNRRP